ncbi:hypothetical protein BpHYR1_000199 [Brachionus plicatilis]|uniref:Shisa N-terminal domain-containing protein n=1 Tax=Brachionus plicatilis TaxID=10195 RepID=A0A3M7SDZ1_BRAPC|nr:hypothetical protein BpHYR1_000199 [Brachionus plicatilis]
MKLTINFEYIFEFFIVVLLFRGFESIELCRQYSIGNLMYNSFYCLDYCCGNCNFRYCCSNETYLIDQNKCTNNIVQLQLEWFTKKAKTANSTITSTRVTTAPKKYQNIVDTCEFANTQPKKCSPNKRFCCGSCQKQYCCNDIQERLNQFECKFLTNYSSLNQDNQANSNSYIYVILTLILVLLLAFACIPFVIFVNKRSKKNNVPNNGLPFQSLVPLSILEQLNSTTISTISDKPKISTTQKEDSPPAYSTIFN